MDADATLSDPLTLLRGATVLVTDQRGRIRPDAWAGLYHHDLRVLSCLRVTLDGREPEPLAAHREGASSALVVGSVATGPGGDATVGGDPTALLLQRADLGEQPTLGLEVRAFGEPLRGATLRIDVEADFVPAQKAAAARRPEPVPWEVDGALRARRGDFAVAVEPSAGAVLGPGSITFDVDAEPGRPWRAQLRLTPGAERDQGTMPLPPPERPTLAVSSPATRWQASVSQALADLDALRVDVPGLGLRYLAAGAPWFMALFGRDTAIASSEALIAGTGTALSVLRSLARYQGAGDDPRTGEQPGRILHELRTGGAEVFGVPSGTPYYGTIDATPLFVMLLAEAHRWGAPDDAVADLLPAARAAVDWCADHGDLDGDGYVEYAPDAGGLVNQGWKDSTDAMVHADGSLARGPIALAEAQAYVHAARRGLADLEERLGDPARASRLRADADSLRAAFHRDFWLPERGVVAMALDGDKRPLEVASSNMGHCLWAGILDQEVADAVAGRLREPGLRTAWGLRTLAASEAAYNPLGYHLGAVWPHDTAIAVAGLRRYGHRDDAARLTEALLAACEAFDWRLPELLAGLDRDETAFPVPYPTACSPQAWAAAVPLLLLREALGLDPDVPAGTVRLAPALPEAVSLTVTGIRVGGGTLDLRASSGQVDVLAAPEGLEIESA